MFAEHALVAWLICGLASPAPPAQRAQPAAAAPAAIAPAAHTAPAAHPVPAAPPAAAGEAKAAGDSTQAPNVKFVPVPQDTSLVFLIQAGNRLYPEWKEEHRVRLHERFPLGDTRNSAEVGRFFPDFRIIDGKPMNVGRTLGNPAIRVFVFEEEAPKDSSWAFLNFPPHFSPHSFYTFQLEQVKGYPAAN
jgi:nucleoid-associated protein YgaU